MSFLSKITRNKAKTERVIIYGESGAGKTFAVTDLVLAIVRGTEWRGHRVNKGRAVYVCGEGLAGFRNRLQAFAQHHEVEFSAAFRLADGHRQSLPGSGAPPRYRLVDGAAGRRRHPPTSGWPAATCGAYSSAMACASCTRVRTATPVPPTGV